MLIANYYGFKAEAIDEFGEVYDASFMVTIIPGGQWVDVEKIINNAKNQFQEFHPNGKILEQMQRNRVIGF